jgi:hypothetical protein
VTLLEELIQSGRIHKKLGGWDREIASPVFPIDEKSINLKQIKVNPALKYSAKIFRKPRRDL